MVSGSVLFFVFSAPTLSTSVVGNAAMPPLAVVKITPIAMPARPASLRRHKYPELQSIKYFRSRAIDLNASRDRIFPS